jgi:hypothetical protein
LHHVQNVFGAVLSVGELPSSIKKAEISIRATFPVQPIAKSLLLRVQLNADHFNGESNSLESTAPIMARRLRIVPTGGPV